MKTATFLIHRYQLLSRTLIQHKAKTQMPNKQQKRAALRNKVSAILLNEWDPIGVKNIKGAEDEYDRWAIKILDFILEGADANKIAHHLAKLQSGITAMKVSPKTLFPVAEKLLAAVE